MPRTGRRRKLTELQRLVVIEAYASKDASCRELASVYGVTAMALYKTYLRSVVRPKSAGLDPDLARQLKRQGVTIARIAAACEVSRATVERFLANERKALYQ
jgi:hypothetical protein